MFLVGHIFRNSILEVSFIHSACTNAGVIGNAFGTVSVAEATCRIFGNSDLDGLYFYRSLDKASDVLTALTSLPASLQPSRLTLTAESVLAEPCAPGKVPTEKLPFNASDLGSGLQNWYHALCAPESDPSWESSGFDPAYQGQQMALTVGLMCITACDVNDKALPGSSLVALGSSDASAQAARDSVCDSYTWVEGNTQFSGIQTSAELAEVAALLLEKPCNCAGV